MSKHSIAALWDRYREKIIPADATQALVFINKHAFYAGAAALMAIMEATACNEFSEDDGVALLDALQEELVAFAKSGVAP